LSPLPRAVMLLIIGLSSCLPEGIEVTLGDQVYNIFIVDLLARSTKFLTSAASWEPAVSRPIPRAEALVLRRWKRGATSYSGLPTSGSTGCGDVHFELADKSSKRVQAGEPILRFTNANRPFC
jgi:hypothetical protein